MTHNFVTLTLTGAAAASVALAACAREVAPEEAVATHDSAAQEAPMPQSIPVLPEAASLAGDWRLSVDDRACDLRLDVADLSLPQPHAPAWRVVDQGGCLGGTAADIAGWRPAPDGMALLRADGGQVFFLSRRGDAYVGPAPAGANVRLARR